MTALPIRPFRLLILGGARSGKSRYAQTLAERRWRRPLYVATAEARDDEMRARVAAHRRARGRRWRCVEAPLELARVLVRPPPGTDGILVDCLTLWLSNVLLQEGPRAVARRRHELLRALRHTTTDVMLVSNEVGLGIVPEHPLGRAFRDEAGRLNQAVAAAVEAVALIVAGLPLMLKGRVE